MANKNTNTTPADMRKEQFAKFIQNMNKQYGEGSVFFGNDEGLKVDALSTGILSLDLAIGVGGFPKGRIIEIYGQESSGKSSIALHVVANAQKEGMNALFIDVENALSPDWAYKLGVDLNNMAVSQPSSGEEALQMVEAALLSRAIDVIVVDSVSALVPRAEVEGAIGDATIGLQARLMSSGLRKLAPIVKETNAIVIFINQIREKVSTTGFRGFGESTTTSGGRALKFYASVRIETVRISTLKEKEEKTGNRVKAIIKKNKVAPPFRECEFDMMFDGGVSRESEIIELGIRVGIINKTGAFYKDSQTGEVIGHGKPAAVQKLKENPKATEDYLAIIMEKLQTGTIKISTVSKDDEAVFEEE